MTRVQRAAAALRNLLSTCGAVSSFIATRAVCQAEHCTRHDVRRAAEQLGVIAVVVRDGKTIETTVRPGEPYAFGAAWRLPTETADQPWVN